MEKERNSADREGGRQQSPAGRGWKKWAAEKGLEKWFRKDNLIILVLTGILLVIIALPTERSGKGEQEEVYPAEEGKRSSEDSADSENAETPQQDTDGMYTAFLEERLTRILGRTADVGEVEVMITLKSSRELVVEKEQPVSRSSTNEKDSQGGSRTVSEVDSSESTVYRTDGSLSEPYVVKTLSPRIEGVLVVAQGAGNGTVDRTIVEIVEALFGVEAHKVKVVRMEQPETGSAAPEAGGAALKTGSAAPEAGGAASEAGGTASGNGGAALKTGSAASEAGGTVSENRDRVSGN